MAYSELIKNFERIRDYMREFFVYGFRSRGEYSPKSVRSYDNERRRIESWLGDCMAFRQGENGKNVFLSVDSREVERNPLFAAFRAKSFTDKDITLFFYVMDLLRDGMRRTAAELQEEIADRCLHPLGSELEFDVSTLRKKLKEFEELGLVRGEKEGNRLYYSLCSSPELEETVRNSLGDAVRFFSEEAPLGVIGSYLEECGTTEPGGVSAAERSGAPVPLRLSHKHHYILDALDSEVMLELLTAIRQRRAVEIRAVSRKGRDMALKLIPLQIFVSTQQGRYYLFGFNAEEDRFDTVRIDSIHRAVPGEVFPEYDAVLQKYLEFRKHLWGVAYHKGDRTRHVEMDIRVDAGEEFIISRLQREARCGSAEQVGEQIWRYSADVYDTREMLPWIRTFTGRILRLESSDGKVEGKFFEDLAEMRRMYTDRKGGAGDAVS